MVRHPAFPRLVQFILSLFLLCHLSSDAVSAELPDGVREALIQNASHLSPISITWERRRSTLLGEADLLRKLGIRDLDFLETITTRAVCDDAMIRVQLLPKTDTQSLERHGASRSGQEWSFDSQNVYAGTGLEAMVARGDEPALSINALETLRRKAPKRRYQIPEYFVDAGFQVARSVDELGQPPKSLVLHLIDQGAEIDRTEQVRVDGDECVKIVLKQPSQISEFFLQPSYGYAVRRRIDFTISGELIRVLDNQDFMKLPGSPLSLPRRCVSRWHSWYTIPEQSNPTPLFVSELFVTTVSKEEVPKQQFALKYDAPGTVIGDSTLPESAQANDGRVVYQVPADQADLDAAIRRASEEQKSKSWPVHYWIIAFATVATLLLLWVWRQRHHKQARHSRG